MKTVNELIKDINKLNSSLHEKDFLLTWEQSPDELKQVLDVADALKTLRAENIATKVFNSGLGISVFRDNSTRTRFSYASALNLLGLAQQDLDEGKSQIAHGETVRETANMISFCADAIGFVMICSSGPVTPICVKWVKRWTTATNREYFLSALR
ncbi:aspartate/ornithine carbamoyltransferase family protein [Cedecea neteri]|uniref:Aspartate/ornithine carbamoyltransferase family protein n=1 Tax=Cedecea neteri TaxID=158822 RepID=A0A2X3JG19_9ENTR|nr:aspartate/ornithine carbamoyltransferase family protein [Cedecea neteri]